MDGMKTFGTRKTELHRSIDLVLGIPAHVVYNSLVAPSLFIGKNNLPFSKSESCFRLLGACGGVVSRGETTIAEASGEGSGEGWTISA